ncbi:uncharacterized protein At4g15970 [Brachypodium distachyon]|uniref:Nucleotide-diphospho-sugar transferase domain-containing protein n=1 Tax=Brachypodium distachyon TaxID=15368 RepID=I1IRK2_BRADI|nr:uncharacterized protein At4g15970 [Brachypodium distachyon]KQJ90879.2 hypothetical protein BRADI_4g34540v3 [Brachypodium distachyon]|eukprot:XP_024310749.1 uncharacterized protein At4g15970 [Brachypodium distachyon]
MFTLSNLLRFVLAAALVAASGVLLFSHSSCPCDVEATRNWTQAHPGIRSPGMATAARKDDDDDLAELLRKAAMEDNTIIMTFTNEAWTAPGSLLDLFLESFRVGDKTERLLKHLVIVTVDGKAFEQCQRVHPLCYSFDAGGGMNLTKEQEFMSGDYLEMMWARNRFQNHVLELGFSFVFTDVDIVWFRNPLLRIPVGADIAISADRFGGDDPYDVWKQTNGGFVSARSNTRTLAFFKVWHEARKAYPGQNEQDVFEKVKHELSTRVGAAVHFVDTAHFGGFCEPKKDFRQLCTFHGNCVKGLKWKLEKLQGVMDEWKQFKDARDRPKNK